MQTAIVSGPIANKAGNGGNAWAMLNWVLGLRELGIDAYFVEQLDREAWDIPADVALTDSEQGRYFASVMRYFGLESRSALIAGTGEESVGLDWDDILRIGRDADLLINVSGHMTVEPLKGLPAIRAYLDLDPGYTQIWEAGGIGGSRLDGHDIYFTVGTNIGTPCCALPTLGLTWHHTWQPIPLGTCSSAEAGIGFTTVGSWRGAYSALEYEGMMYGIKAHEFRRFVELPRLVAASFTLALDIHPGDDRDIQALDQHGWQLVDPLREVGSPEAFQHFVARSMAEFSAAQGMYVQSRSGWLSDRTARYLASGKPVLVQDTGIERLLPLGEGLLVFSTLAEAVTGIEQIQEQYRHHAEAARSLAREHFAAKKVLGAFLDRVESKSRERRSFCAVGRMN